jgi:hypothetical protein
MERRRETREWGNVEKCVNCQFYDRRNARSTDARASMWGQCRRHPAHLNPLSVKSHNVEGVWPLVRDDDWCGEWKASTPASISRTQSTPRIHELPVTAAVATSAAGARSAPAVLAAVAAVGDD